MEETCIVIVELGKGLDYFIKGVAIPLLTSWPVVALVVFICLRKTLISILCKTKFGYKDGKITAEPLEQRPHITDSLPGELNETEYAPSKRNRKRINLPPYPENNYKKYLEKVILDVKKQLKQNPFHEVDILIRDDAIFRMSTEFEQIYYSIFGSQIAFLDFLMSEKNKTSTAYKMHSFFNKEKNERKWQIDVNYNKWVSYMIDMNLILKDKQGKIVITDKAIAFLTYIYEKHYDLKTGLSRL